MAVDYCVLYPCEVRNQVSTEELIEMEKAASRAEAILDIMRKQPGEHHDKPESEWTFSFAKLSSNGSQQEQDMRIGDLLKQAEPLQKLQTHCVNCPMNFLKRPFGCGGAIHYPITLNAEKWLMSRLPDDINSPQGKILTSMLHDVGITGKFVDKERSRTEVYESSTALMRKWGGLFFGKRITSSQILELLLGVGNYECKYAQIIAWFFGFLNDTFEYSKNPDNMPLPTDDPAVQEFKAFFMQVTNAAARQLEVYIDS